jgi:hypothetical protein
LTFLDVAGLRTLLHCAARIAPIATTLVVRDGSIAHQLSTVTPLPTVASLSWEVLP